MRARSVFLIGDDERSAAVADLVAAWTAAGILTPSLWVTPAGVEPSEHGPARVAARVVGSEGVSDVDLFEELGRYRSEVIRFTVVHLIDEAGSSSHPSGTQAVRQTARQLAELLVAALPLRNASAEGPRLRRSVVVVPASSVVEIGRGLFVEGWDANVLVSPEDRPDLDRVSNYVRDPGNLRGHAAAAVAAIGGIVQGIDAGPLDDIEPNISGEVEVTVARATLRTVVGPDVLDHLMDRVLSTSDDHLPPAEALTWARPAADPVRLSREGATAVLGRPEWAPRPEPAHEPVRRSIVGVGPALRQALRFNLRTTGAVLALALARGRVGFERRATEALVGDEAGTLVTLGPRQADDLARTSARLLEHERQRAQRHINGDTERVQALQPTTWSELRRIAFALVDGGPVEGMSEPRQAGKRELLGPAAIVLPVESVYRSIDGVDLDAHDPGAIIDHQQRLRDEAAEIDGALAALDQAVAAETLDPDDAADLEQRAEAIRERRQVVRDAKENLATWVETVQHTLVGAVGLDLAQRERSAAAELDATNAPAAVTVPAHDRLTKAQQTLTRTWAIGLPIVLLASVLALLRYFVPPFFGAATSDWTIGLLVGVLAAIITVGTLVLGSANHRYYKAVQAYEFAVEEKIETMRREGARIAHLRQERSRLHFMLEALQDWAGIIATLLHTPWAPGPEPVEGLSDEIVAALPAAMAVATPPATGHQFDPSILVAAYGAVHRPGWVARQYERASDAFAERDGGEGDEGFSAADLDMLASSLSPRRRFAQYVSFGAAREAVTERARSTLRELFSSGDLPLPVRRVKRLGRYSDEVEILEPEFLRATAADGDTLFVPTLFTPDARQRRAHSVARSRIWLPAHVSGLDLPGTALPATGPTALRVDLSVPLDEDDLLLLAIRHETPPSTPAAGKTTSRGDDRSQVWV